MLLALFALIFFVREWRKYWIIYATIGPICLSIMAFFMADRYRLPVLPFLIIMAAAGMTRLSVIARKPGSTRLFWGALLVLLFTIEIRYASSRVKKSNFANDYYNLSLAHLIEDDPKGAVYWGKRAIADDPSLQNAHYNLGVAFLKLNEHDKAFEAFSSAVALDSTDAGAQRNLGALLLLRQNYKKALHHLEASVKLDANNVNALMNLGLAYYYLGKYDKAIQSWEKILENDPQNQQARNNIKAVEAALGNK